MDSASLVQIAAILFCLALSAFFSASEAAFLSLTPARVKADAQRGNRRASLVLSLLAQKDRLLSTILLGDVAANAVAACLGVLLFSRYMPRFGALAAAVLMTLVILLVGEISPKAAVEESPESFAIFAAPLLQSVTTIFTPLSFLASCWKKLLLKLLRQTEENKVTPEELKLLVDEAQHEGEIDERNGELIISAIEFNSMEAYDILTPRVDIVAVEENDSMDAVSMEFLSHSFSRLLVYRETVDRIVGMIHEKDFYRALHQGKTSIESILKKVVYITGSMKISDLLRLLQQTSTHVAVVVDEFGGTEGIVTMEDILEQLVGDIWDENDTVIQYFQKLDDKTYLVAGRTNLEEMFEEFHLNRAKAEYDSVTVSGWVMEQLGKIPAAGDRFTFEGARFTVTQTDKRHVLQVQVKLPATQEGAADAEAAASEP